MKTIATTLLITISFLSVKSHTFPDKIKIVQNTYKHSLYNVELYYSDTIVLTNKRKISKLFTELKKYDHEEQLLEKFEIDTAFIRNNLDEVLSLYDGKNTYDRNEKELIFEKLNNVSVCYEELSNYITN